MRAVSDQGETLCLRLGFWGIRTSIHLSSYNPIPPYFAAAGISRRRFSPPLLLEVDHNWGFINLGVGLFMSF